MTGRRHSLDKGTEVEELKVCLENTRSPLGWSEGHLEGQRGVRWLKGWPLLWGTRGRGKGRSLWLVWWVERGPEAKDQLGGCCNNLGEGRELAGELGSRAGQAGGGSLWRLLRGWPEPGPRVWWAQS